MLFCTWWGNLVDEKAKLPHTSLGCRKRSFSLHWAVENAVPSHTGNFTRWKSGNAAHFTGNVFSQPHTSLGTCFLSPPHHWANSLLGKVKMPHISRGCSKHCFSYHWTRVSSAPSHGGQTWVAKFTTSCKTCSSSPLHSLTCRIRIPSLTWNH